MPPKGVGKNKKQGKSTIIKALPKVELAPTMATVTTSDAAVEEGPKPIYFWREYGDEWGFLSQWYESPFTTADKSIVFHTAEQYMMYQKAILFSDPDTGAAILETFSPKEQKALGRRVQNFDNDVWIKKREDIVEEGSYWKFKNCKTEGEDLKALLLGTGDKQLVEASSYDKIWGIGFKKDDAEKNRTRWGLNLLGKALMRARERIREEEKNKEAEAEAEGDS